MGCLLQIVIWVVVASAGSLLGTELWWPEPDEPPFLYGLAVLGVASLAAAVPYWFRTRHDRAWFRAREGVWSGDEIKTADFPVSYLAIGDSILYEDRPEDPPSKLVRHIRHYSGNSKDFSNAVEDAERIWRSGAMGAMSAGKMRSTLYEGFRVEGIEFQRDEKGNTSILLQGEWAVGEMALGAVEFGYRGEIRLSPYETVVARLRPHPGRPPREPWWIERFVRVWLREHPVRPW